MKARIKTIVILQILFITTIAARNTNYFGYLKVGSGGSTTKLYSTSPMEMRFKSSVEKFVNKRSERITKNEILRTVQLKNADSELKKLEETSRDICNEMIRASTELERLGNENQTLKLMENLKMKQLEILELENKNFENISIVENFESIVENNRNFSSNSSVEKENDDKFNSTETIEKLNEKLTLYGKLSNNLDLISEQQSQIDNITKLRLDLGDELLLNIFEYHISLDKFHLAQNLENAYNDFLSKWENFQKNFESINDDLLRETEKFSALNFNDIGYKAGDLLYEINNPNFNDEKLADTLLKKMTKSIKDELLSKVKWVTVYDKVVLLPENSVEGGADDDKSIYYIIRKELNHKYYYGKYLRSGIKKNAYITTENEEKGVDNFEILTSPTHLWCDYDKNKQKDYMDLPICRANYYGSLIPGTLEENGNCRIGFGNEVERFSKGQFEVLQIQEC